MSGFIEKAKKKVGLFVDKLRPTGGPRAPSPTPTDPNRDRDPTPIPPLVPAPHPPQAVGAKKGSVIHVLLAAAGDGFDLCLPLQVALNGVVNIWDVCEHTTQVKEEYEKLERRLMHLAAMANAYGKRGNLDSYLTLRLTNIAASFELLDSRTQAKLEGGASRVFESNEDVADIKELLLKLSSRIQAFLYECTTRVKIAVDAILTGLPSVKDDVLREELVNWGDITKAIGSALSGRRVSEAAYDAQLETTGCMHGTRVDLLSELIEWVNSETAKSILWLTGMAGTGKTSVAVTLCRMLDSDPDVLLGGTFFCSRSANVEARTDVRRILPTLAALFAHQSPEFAAALVDELSQWSDLFARYQHIDDQIGPLLEWPLDALAAERRPIVFVIDALDECSNERELGELLAAIAGFECRAKVKFILTSRPETQILGSSILDGEEAKILHLHAIKDVDVNKDIRLYIDATFAKQSPASSWYTDTDVTELTALSNGLFIFASTIISYILAIGSVEGRTTRLKTVLSATVSDSAVAMRPLDAMYEFVFARASSADKVEPKELDMTRRNLACILALRVPLSVTALAELLNLDTSELRDSLSSLNATVYVPESDDEPGLRMLHVSFGDYLVNRAPPNLRVSVPQGDELLARGCLRIMRTRLHFNISQSCSSHEPNPSVKPKLITLSLEYACLQWIHHVSRLVQRSYLDEDINGSFRPRFLFWLEVISVLGQVQHAAAMLIIAAATIKLPELSQFLRDANSFIASSQDAIRRSAPHIYLSALPFAAKDSMIYRDFFPLCTGLVCVDTLGIEGHDRHLVMTLTGHKSWVNSIAYSPDGHLFASGSTDGKVHIWDIRTGDMMMAPLGNGDGAVNTVAIDPTGKHLASGTEGGTVCIWSLVAGQEAPQRLDKHNDIVWCVTFSPNGSLLASASNDRTVCLWGVEKSQEVFLLRHTHGVRTVAFSPDGLLASGSDDNAVRLWSSSTGKLDKLLVAHLGSINAVCFSPDGTKLASGSDFDRILLWDPQTGSKTATLSGDAQFVRSIMFSPDGQSLAAAVGECSVNIWNLRQDASESPPIVLDGHSGWVCCVTFSPDGKHIASASSDRTIRIWDAESSQAAVQPLQAHRSAVNMISVSPDGTFIVSGSADRSVRVWDTHTGEAKLVPLLGHTDAVSSVAISKDGRLVASASKDHTVRLWDMQKGKEVAKLLPGSADKVNAVAFSPDLRWLASGLDNGTVHVWDVSKRQQSNVGPLKCNDSVLTVSYSPDGRLLAAGDYSGCIHLWQAENGQRARMFKANSESINSIAFSIDGTCIVSGGADQVVRIWNTVTGDEIQIFQGHTDRVLAVAYSSDGGLIGSSSADGTVHLWKKSAAIPAATLHGHGDWVQSVAFTPDGQSMVTCSTDSTIRIWDVKAALGLPSEYANDNIEALTSTDFDDGWLLGSDRKLLLWVPTEYRAYAQTSICKILIGRRRVLIESKISALLEGKDWAGCWRHDESDTSSRAA